MMFTVHINQASWAAPKECPIQCADLQNSKFVLQNSVIKQIIKNNVNAKNKKVQNYFAKLMPSIYYTLFILLSAGDLVRRTKCFLTMRRLIKENVGQVTNVCQRDKVCFLLRALTANQDVHDSYVKLLLLNLEMIELHF